MQRDHFQQAQYGSTSSTNEPTRMGQGAPVVMHEQLRRHIERAQALLSGDAGPLQISDAVSEKKVWPPQTRARAHASRQVEMSGLMVKDLRAYIEMSDVAHTYFLSLGAYTWCSSHCWWAIVGWTLAAVGQKWAHGH